MTPSQHSAAGESGWVVLDSAAGRLALLSKRAMRAHAPYMAILAAYALALGLIVHTHPGHVVPPFLSIVGGILAVTVTLVFSVVSLYRLYVVSVHRRPDNLLRAYAADVAATLFDGRRWATGLPMTLVVLPFMYVYATFKYNIPVLAPFGWDATFEAWDRALHLGHPPWELLQPVLGGAFAMSILDANYLVWALAVWGTTIAIAFSGVQDELRARFFFTYLLCWTLGGTLLAIQMSSVGPCYWTLLGLPGDPYAGLMARIQAVDAIIPIKALVLQKELWASYVGEGTIAGISAMPSMHNAMALLVALAMPKLAPRLSVLAWAHCALVYAGSVLLAWHYAVDAYLSWAVTYASWRASARFARWWNAEPAVRALDDVLDREFPRSPA
jgi:hypothetical protein